MRAKHARAAVAEPLRSSQAAQQIGNVELLQLKIQEQCRGIGWADDASVAGVGRRSAARC
jgi:hypothetical protein